MAGVRANVREGNNQISLATEDMFIWGQVHTDLPEGGIVGRCYGVLVGSGWEAWRG